MPYCVSQVASAAVQHSRVCALACAFSQLHPRARPSERAQDDRGLAYFFSCFGAPAAARAWAHPLS
eukprot:3135145-Pleurochrysis_carterae.AAC.3